KRPLTRSRPPTARWNRSRHPSSIRSARARFEPGRPCLAKFIRRDRFNQSYLKLRVRHAPPVPDGDGSRCAVDADVIDVAQRSDERHQVLCVRFVLPEPPDPQPDPAPHPMEDLRSCRVRRRRSDCLLSVDGLARCRQRETLDALEVFDQAAHQTVYGGQTFSPLDLFRAIGSIDRLDGAADTVASKEPDPLALRVPEVLLELEQRDAGELG